MAWCRRYPRLSRNGTGATQHRMAQASMVRAAGVIPATCEAPQANIVKTHTAPHPTNRSAPPDASQLSFFFDMADQPVTATGAAPAESPAQKQARLRRERRAAKLADGENRLQAITALQGGTHRDVKKDLPGMSFHFPPSLSGPLKRTCKLTAAQSSPPPHRRCQTQLSQGHG